LYSSGQSAANAVAALQEWGFTDDMISVVRPGPSTSKEAVVSALTSAFVVRGQALQYADAVLQGQTAVVVRAEFGRGEAAQYHMNSAGPVSREDSFREPFTSTWDEAAPISSMFGLATTSEFRPLGGLPTITRRGNTLGAKLGIAEVSPAGRPTTEGWGMPTLLKSGPALRAFFKG
jgi:hypothetical protein